MRANIKNCYEAGIEGVAMPDNICEKVATPK